MNTRIKELSEMTTEELWELFPIFLVEPNPNWHEYYLEMENSIMTFVPKETIYRISHIGSTSIKDIWAKNIVDILVEIEPSASLDDTIRILTNNQMILMQQSTSKASLNYGYTKHGFSQKVYHIHIRYRGDNDELYFRDYLNEHSDVAKEYEKLKLLLWHQYEHDRDGYTNAKTTFIKKYTKLAKSFYKNKYK